MPIKIKSIGHNRYQTSGPHGVHGKNMTLANAKKQAAIINAADAGHPFTGKKKGHGVGHGVGHKK
jgi:hypothetical protein